MANITLEGLFDKISEKIINNLDIFTDETILGNQKVIRGGLLTTGRQPGEKLVLFDKDVIANSEDLLQETLNDLGDQDENQIGIHIKNDGTIEIHHSGEVGDGVIDITSIVGGIGSENPLNVGQFIDFDETTSNIDSTLAQEFLDTNIFELLQMGDTRQQQINKFFAEYAALKGNNPPIFDDTDGDGFVSDDFGDQIVALDGLKILFDQID